MLNHSHAFSGACTGTAAGIALHMPVPAIALLAGFTAGFATLPDLDKCGSGPARCLGPLSELLAWVIGKVCRGHRHLTHAILGVVIFTGLAEAACHYRHDLAGRIGLMLFLSLAFSAGLWALHIESGVKADIGGIAAAAAVTWLGVGLPLVPLACGLGWITHILGDCCTDSHVMLAYPFSHRKFGLPEPLAFTTGSLPETRIVDPLLAAALVVLGAGAVDPSGLALVAGHLYTLA